MLNQYDLDKVISDMTLNGYSQEEIKEYLDSLEREETHDK